jgi:hypothetical protein
MERVVSGLSFPVGLAAAPEGGLVIAEAGAACMLQVGADGNRRGMARVPGAPMGLAPTSRGAFLVADNGGKYPPAPTSAARWAWRTSRSAAPT